MAIKKIEYYETSNGLTFLDETEAIEAEKTYKVKENLMSLLNSADFSDNDCNRISEFIANNRKTIAVILNNDNVE